MIKKSKKLSIKTIAKLSGVHFSTVSKVLNNYTKEKISDKTVKKIQQAVKKTGYRRNLLASRLRNGMDFIAYIACDYSEINNPFRQEIMGKIQAYLGKCGKNIIYHEHTEDLPDFMQNQADVSLYKGIIMTGNSGTLLPQVPGLAVLELFRKTPSMPGASVLMHDENQAAELALDMCREKKIRKIKLIAVKQVSDTIFRSELLKKKAGSRPGISITCEVFNTREEIYSLDGTAARKLCSGCDLVFVLAPFGMRMYHLLVSSGIKIPEDIYFLLFDDLSSNRFLFPEVSALGLDYNILGQKVFDFFFKNEKPAALKIPCVLNIRKSLT